jgi:hypothetical protein
MIRTLSGFIVRTLLAALFLAGYACAVGVTDPVTAGAYATIAPPPIYSSAPGLPDGRVYEQVSPADKNGNNAGASTDETAQYGGLAHYALSAPEGNSVLFEGSGPMGESAAGYNLYFVAERSASGWHTRGILPRATERRSARAGIITVQPERLDPSTDLSHVMFKSSGGLFAPPPYPQCGYEHRGNDQLYLGGSDPFLAATWLERAQISDPIENCAGGFGVESGEPVGGTPNFSTVYFTFPGTLLPEDASRAPHAHGEGEREESRVEAWGLYEYSGGVLKEAGVLPNGSLDPFGAVPAASLHGRALVGNQVSADGSRLFFVSPDPASCGRGNNCAVDPPELYVRENGDQTQLISRDTLLPQVGGLPASAPDGLSEMPNPNYGTAEYEEGHLGSDVFASADGSQAFFQSEDQLTSSAPEGPPANTTAKTYDFDVDTGGLNYLPGVSGQIVAATLDGSSFAFVNSSTSPAELDLWSAGAGGGTVTRVTQLPAGGASVARLSTDGSTLVFMTGGQIYRYYLPTNTVGCISCAPQGLSSGYVEMSPLQANEGNVEAGLQTHTGLVDERGVSANGSRVFFDTTAALVPQDTDGVSDVYEWENGAVYLLSSGTSTRPSHFLDNSEDGSDVFFATSESLVPGDTDGAYDVYDARIPHPGDNPPAAAVPCEGSVCQGPPRVPAPLSAPASATFSGLGNTAAAVVAKTVHKVEPKAKPTRARKLSSALKECRKESVKRRAGCEARARKRYGANAEAKNSNRGGK